MTATKKWRELPTGARTEEFANGQGRWVHEGPDGVKTQGKDFIVVGPFGSVESAVVVNPDGSPNFDRPVYRETPNVNIIAFGRDAQGKVRIGIIRQPRPHADDPEQPGNNHAPVVFGQIPMGFLERLIGKDQAMRYEKAEAGAIREVGEETGATAIKGMTRPKYPHMFPNPTFCATWSDLYFIEVDLTQVDTLKQDHHEPIYSAEYVEVSTLLRWIRDGKDDRGAVYRMGISLADLMVFFATHPELFSATDDNA